MTRFDQEPRLPLGIREATAEQVEAFDRKLQAKHGYASWHSQEQYQTLRIREKAKTVRFLVAVDPGSQEIAGAMILKFDEDDPSDTVRVSFVYSDPNFASLRSGAALIQHLQRPESPYNHILLGASPFIQEANITKEQLVKFYQRLGFGVVSDASWGALMEWTRKN